MHHLKNKICPLFGKTCLVEGCAMFSEQLDDCKINMINYNLYASTAKIQALIDNIKGVPESGTDSDYEPINRC